MKYLVIFLMLFGTAKSYADEEGERDVLKQCLRSWEKHPFSEKTSKYRVLRGGVQVLGIGHNIEDHKETATPELILVQPSVSVLSSGLISLMNPNGWYCIKGKVAVLSKVKIEIDCKAKLASSSDGATVLGSNHKDDGVTVLGKSEIKRVGCKSTDTPKVD